MLDPTKPSSPSLHRCPLCPARFHSIPPNATQRNASVSSTLQLYPPIDFALQILYTRLPYSTCFSPATPHHKPQQRSLENRKNGNRLQPNPNSHPPAVGWPPAKRYATPPIVILVALAIRDGGEGIATTLQWASQWRER